MTTKSRSRSVWAGVMLAAILILSLWIRLHGIDWDDYYHLHPDERYIVWVGTTIEWPDDWATALDPTLSSLNPFHWPPDATSAGIKVEQAEPRSFAYGHWPLYLGVAATQLLSKGETWAANLPESWMLLSDLLNGPGRIEYHHLLIVGRALAALADTVTVALVYLIGREVYGRSTGLLAAALVGLAVLHIQSAHFFVTDPFLAAAVVAALYWMVRRIQGGSWRQALAAGALVGLAVGAKFSAVLLVVPLAVAVSWERSVPPVARGASLARRAGRWWRWLRRPAGEFVAAMLVGVVAFALTNPFALLDTTCEASIGGFTFPLVNLSVPRVVIHSCYLENIGTQGAMVRGGTHIPYTYQYIGTAPYSYYLDQMFRWGLGPALALLGTVGFVWTVARAIRRRHGGRDGELALLSWTLPFFLVTGSFEVKFLRYLLPLTPFLAIYGASMMTGGWRWATGTGGARKPVKLMRALAVTAAAVTLAITLFWAAAYAGMLDADQHPWVAASEWVQDNVPADAKIATEHWDYALPINLRGTRLSYESTELEWFYVQDRQGREKTRVELEDALAKLAGSDYMILASNRLYGVIPRLPERFPEASAYYRLLFAGELGWDLVHWSGRYPNLAGLALADDTFGRPDLPTPEDLAGWKPAPLTLVWGAADESFTVYDHPLVLIFENRARLSADEMELAIRREAALLNQAAEH